MIIEGKQAVLDFRTKMLLIGLRTEIKGMRLTSKGPTCYSIIKREFGFKGSKQKVLEQLEQYIKKSQS